MMSTIRRHLLPICCTAAFILVTWLIITLPIVAVFLFDKQFVISDYLKFVLYAAGVGVGTSVAVIFPLSLLFERLVEGVKPLAVAVPLILLFASFACLLGRFFLTGQFFDSVFGWAGLLFAFSVVFGFYWVVLWTGRALIYGVQRFRQKASA
jgi:hypothetical protein